MEDTNKVMGLVLIGIVGLVAFYTVFGFLIFIKNIFNGSKIVSRMILGLNGFDYI